MSTRFGKFKLWPDDVGSRVGWSDGTYGVVLAWGRGLKNRDFICTHFDTSGIFKGVAENGDHADDLRVTRVFRKLESGMEIVELQR